MGMSMIRAVFEKSTDAFNRHDIEAFKECLADDVSSTAPGNVRLQGKEEVGGYYKAWMEGFPDAQVTIRDVQIMDECVLEEGTFRGTHRGALRTPNGDIPPTGRSVEAKYVQVIRMRGDRMASLDLTYDRLELLEQLGMAGSPGTGDTSERRQGGASQSEPLI